MRRQGSAVLAAAVGVCFIMAMLPVSARRHAGTQEGAASQGTLVYADFETVAEGRPVSSRGGLVQLFGYQENTQRPAVFKGIEGASPAAPQVVRIKPEDTNHLAKFDVEFQAPNQYAGVVMEVRGQPDRDGKAAPEDLSSYKSLSLQVFAKGVETMRVELVSHGQGIELQAYPQIILKPKEGLNTYRLPLKTFGLPAWMTDTRVDPKDVLKKLTAVNVSAYCDDCRPASGMVVVDNIVFEK